MTVLRLQGFRRYISLPGGCSDLVWTSVPLEPKPILIFKGHFGRYGYPFWEIFLKIFIGPFFKFVGCSHGERNTQKFWKIWKKQTHDWGYLCRKWDPCIGISLVFVKDSILGNWAKQQAPAPKPWETNKPNAKHEWDGRRCKSQPAAQEILRSTLKFRKGTKHKLILHDVN